MRHVRTPAAPTWQSHMADVPITTGKRSNDTMMNAAHLTVGVTPTYGARSGGTISTITPSARNANVSNHRVWWLLPMYIML